MNLNDYQEKARATAIYSPAMALIYPALGLSSESGEFAGKVKKWLRDDVLVKEQLVKELGDVLWYVANCASDLGVSLDTVAEINISKLSKRMEEGTIKGEGDDR